jgi:hypothetical protein
MDSADAPADLPSKRPLWRTVALFARFEPSGRAPLGDSPLGESPLAPVEIESRCLFSTEMGVFTKTARNAVSTLAASGATPEVAGVDPTPYSTNTAQQRRSFLRVERHTRSVRLRFVIQMTNSLRDWCSVQVRDEPHGPQV